MASDKQTTSDQLIEKLETIRKLEIEVQDLILKDLQQSNASVDEKKGYEQFMNGWLSTFGLLDYLRKIK